MMSSAVSESYCESWHDSGGRERRDCGREVGDYCVLIIFITMIDII